MLEGNRLLRGVFDRQEVTNQAELFFSSPFYRFTTKTFRDSSGRAESDLIALVRLTCGLGERRTEGMQVRASIN
jgi:hypothetical protein